MPDDQSAKSPDNTFDSLKTLSTAGDTPIRLDNRKLPDNIGRYRIIRVLGEGGMGTVFEAEQDQPRRSVALKVIQAAWASPKMLQRFELEAHALGRLNYPGIAQIFEAGTADTGAGVQPFFAMELIHGRPLTEYAAKHNLDVRQRLALMIKVCDAVQHAHQRGIIHRDLKPGNILVDDMGQPKILDFGLARATDSDAQVTRQTDVGQLLGTLAYMSPEQVLADPLALDTRSDVYALGVILYELLAEKMPYTLSRQMHEALRVIQESDPAPLSAVSRVYRGDIETIVSKALEKDKARRYSSSADLAADIRRYLDDQPIAAKPASVSYQLQKFARRHKVLATSAAAVVVALLLGVVASTWEAIRARKAEREAQRQSEIAQAVNNFLQKDLLAQASAYTQSKPDPDLKVRAALDRAAQNIGGKFDRQPEVEAAIRETIGTTYTGLGLYPEARQQLERALELQRRAFGPNNQKTIETMLHLANAEEAQGKFTDAEALAKQTLDLSRSALGPDHPDTLKTMNRLTSIDDELGKFSEGEALARQAVDISRRVNGPDSLESATSMYFLAIMLYEQGKYAEAQKLDEQVLKIRRRLLGPDHPDTLNVMNNLAAAYGSQDKFADSEALDKQLVNTRRRVLGPDHPDTLDSMVNLAFDYRGQNKFADAEAIDRQVLEIQRRVLGPEHPNTLRSMHNLADDLRERGQLAQAESLDNQVLEIRRRVLGPDNPDTLWSMSNLAFDYHRAGKYEQAAALDAKTAEARARVLGPKNPLALQSLGSLAADYKDLGDYSKAEAVYRRSYELAPDDPSVLNRLAWFLLTVPDARRRRDSEALDLARKAVTLAGENAGNECSTLGLALIRSKNWDEAITALNKSLEFDKGSEPADFLLLAMAYQGHGNPAYAEKSFAHGVELAHKKSDADSDTKALWAESAKLLNKSH